MTTPIQPVNPVLKKKPDQVQPFTGPTFTPPTTLPAQNPGYEQFSGPLMNTTTWKPPTGQPPTPIIPPPPGQLPPPQQPGPITNFGPGDDLRFSQINPTPSATTQQNQGYVNQAAQNLSNFGGIPQYGPISPTDPSQAYGYLGQAGQATNQAIGQGLQAGQNLPQFQGVAPTDFSQSYGMLGQASQAGQQAAQRSPFQGIQTPNLSGAYGQVGQAGQYVQGANAPQFQNVAPTDFSQAYGTLGQAQQLALNTPAGQGFAPGQDTAAARQALSSGLQGLQGPNRSQLALDALKTFDEQQADVRQRGIQDIGRAGARLGRLGSGMVTTDLGNLEERLQGQREQTLRGLAGDTASQQLNDQLQRLQATGGVAGQLFGQDVTGATTGQGLQSQALQDQLARSGALQGIAGQQAAFGQAQYGQTAAERNAGLQAGQFGAQQDLARAGLSSQLGNQLAGFGQQEYGNLANERQAGQDYGFQGSQLGFQNAGLQAQLANQLAGLGQASYGQQFGERQAGLDYGLQGAGLGLQGAGLGLQGAGQLANLGQTQFGIGQAGFNQQLTNQQQGTSQAQAQQQALLNSLGAFGGLQGQSFGQDIAQQEALRGERGYQQGVAQQTLGNQITQQQLQAALQQQLFGQQYANQDLALRGADLYNTQATGAFGDVGDLFTQIGEQQGYGTPPYNPDAPTANYPSPQFRLPYDPNRGY